MPFRTHRRTAIVVALSLIVVACGSMRSSPTGSPTSIPASSPTSDVALSIACPSSRPAAPSVPWWSDAVFYEVFVRSFADSNGDGIGDLRGLTDRLDYLNDGDPSTTTDLGVTAMWLMPIDESPSYHGYDVTDYRTVERDYGTNDDFKALVAAAGARGIAIIVDLVVNHSSVEHPWFRDARTPGSEHDDWYVWADEHPGFGGPAGPVWHENGGRWYYGYFWEGMPDLNVANPAVTAELDSIARFWVEEMGAAGFRLDAARHLIENGDLLANAPETFTWLQGFRARLRAAEPAALLLGEVWDATSISSKYVEADALDLAFEFGLASAIVSGVRFGDAHSLAAIQEEVGAAYPSGGYASFLTNHDQDRVFDQLGRDPAAAKQAATLLLTSPGVPFIYYGEELGMRGRKPDERIRTPMAWDAGAPNHGFSGTGDESVAPWERFADGVETANVAVQAADPGSIRSHYRALISLRDAHPALRGGVLVQVESDTPAVYAYLRHDPTSGETVAVISNLTDEAVPDAALRLVAGPLCGTPTATNLIDGGSVSTPPVVNAAGGFEAWRTGPLPAHGDVLIRLGP